MHTTDHTLSHFMHLSSYQHWIKLTASGLLTTNLVNVSVAHLNLSVCRVLQYSVILDTPGYKNIFLTMLAFRNSSKWDCNM